MPAPQIRLAAPSPADVRAWLIAQPDAPPPYPAAGATRDAPTNGRPPPGVPAGWNVDHRRVHLGDGEAVYRAAQAALMTYAPLDIGWVWPVTTTPKPEPASRGAMIVRAFGMVWVNAWRVVYVDDDIATADGGRRTAFAYGTMEAHAERGEERFMVELAPDGSVWYDILAFSHPHHVLARLGGPVTRWLQRRFGPASVGRMREVVEGAIGDGVAPPEPAAPAEAMDVNARSRWPSHRYGRSAMVLLAKWLVPAGAVILALSLLSLLGTDDPVDGMEPVLFSFLFVGLSAALVLALPLAIPHVMDRNEDRAMAAMLAFHSAPICLIFLTDLIREPADSHWWSIVGGLPTLTTVFIVAWFTLAALRPVLRNRTRIRRTIPDTVLRGAFILWFVGAVWIAFDAFNYAPLGFPQPIVRLTAIHFHFAGFIVPVIAATLARAYPSRLANVAAVVALLGVPSTAIGITATQLGAPHVVEALLAIPMIAGALLVAAVHLALAFGTHNLESPMRVVTLRAVVGLTLVATMMLALAYALRAWLPWSPTIPQMAVWHGVGNAFGVAMCGLVACWLDPATQPPAG